MTTPGNDPDLTPEHGDAEVSTPDTPDQAEAPAAGQGVQTPTADPAPAAPVPAPAPKDRSSATLWVVVAVIAAIVLGAGAFMLLNSSSSNPTPAPSPSVVEVKVPDVVGLDQAEANNVLVAAGFLVGDVVDKPTMDAPAGTVLAQSPEAGRSLPTGSKISLQVAQDNSVLVPDLTGMTKAQATNTLLAARLTLGAVTAQPDPSAPDTVLSQDPKPGSSTPSGAPVNIVVSNGQQVVPDVIGKTEAAARAKLADAGYRVEVVFEDVQDKKDDGMVLNSNPPAGKSVEVGKTVVLTIGKLAPAPSS